MVTLLRLIRLNYLRIKWKTALWSEFDRQAKELIRNPEAIEEKILPYIAELVHRSAEFENKR